MASDFTDFEDDLYIDIEDESLSTLPMFFTQRSATCTLHTLKVEGMETFLAAANTRERFYDLAELCGGEGRTSVMSIRMKLKTGENFDIVTGTDLNIPIEQKHVRQYFMSNTVLVAVMAPMCTPFGPMGQFNEHKYPEGWARSYNMAAPHGRFCGEIAKIQLSKKLHFIREHPHPTTLDLEPPWPDVLATPGVTRQLWDRCRTGLVFRDKPCRKTSEMVGSCPQIVAPFHGLRCNCTVQHAQACGDGSQALQLWTWDEAQRVVAGICAVKKLYHEANRISRAHVAHSYPSIGTGPDDPDLPARPGRPPKWTSCPGCVRRRRDNDTDHAIDGRGARNPNCKFIGKGIDIWYPDCPGCKEPRKHRSKGGANGHNYEMGKCRWAPTEFTSRFRESKGKQLGKPSSGHHPREPRVPAEAEPTAGLPAHDGEQELGKDDEELAKSMPLPEKRRWDKSKEYNPSASSRDKIDFDDKAVGTAKDVDWTNFDIGGVLRALQLTSEAARRRILRKLHLRWWHAPKKSMKRLLSQAGCGKEILDLIDPIVDTCASCRAWSQPLPQNVASTNVPGEFNESVECDILFYLKKMIFHCIDRATRWHAAMLIGGKDEVTLTKALDAVWVGIHGPMKELIMDGEKGMTRSSLSNEYLKRHGITLVPRAVGQHAKHIERRGGLLELQLSRMDTQLQKEGILQEIPLEFRLRDAVFVGNAMLTTNDTTPYNAVYGRVPRILPNLPNSIQDDAVDGAGSDAPLPGLIRHSHRLREIAVQRVVEATAAARVDRALNTQTRPPVQASEYHMGDQVEFWEPPKVKNSSGWHGPATIIDLTYATRGMIRIRFLQDYKNVQPSRLRRWIGFFCLFMVYGVSQACSTARDVVWRAVEHMNAGRTLLLGWTKYAEASTEVWRWAKSTRLYMRVFMAAMKVARDGLQLRNCCAVRLGRGMYKLPGIDCYSKSIVTWWTADKPYTIKQFEADGSSSVDLAWAAGCDVERRRNPQIQFVQYFLVSQDIIDMPKPDLNEMETHESNSSSSTPTPLPTAGGSLTPITEEESDDGESYFIHEDLDLKYACAIAYRYCMEDCHSERVSSANDDGLMECLMSSTSPPSQLLQNDVFISPNFQVRMANRRAGLPEDAYLTFEPPEEECVYVEFSGDARKLVYGIGDVPEGHIVTMKVYESVQRLAAKKAVIERDTDNLTPEEIVKHKDEIAAAVLKELQTWQKYKCFSRKPRNQSSNIIDTRWVFKWKWELLPSGDKRHIIRARLTVRGFKDRDKGTLGTYAGTAQRYSQRIVVSEAVVQGWDLCTADVNKAFLQGVTYEELAKLTGEPIREVNFYLPSASIPFLKQVEGFENFNPMLEVLHCDKPGTGLIDAPRAFSMKLNQVTKDTCGLMPTSVDPELVAKHVAKRLVALMTKHVDDLKVTGEDETVKHVFSEIGKVFGDLKVEKHRFTNCGVRHIQDPQTKEVTLDQTEYISALKPITHSELSSSSETDCSQELQGLYMSLLGAACYCLLTRVDAAVYLTALQRMTQQAKIIHVKRLNSVVRWLQRNPKEIKYPRMPNQLTELLLVSDAAFKKEDLEGHALKGALYLRVAIDGVKHPIKLNTLEQEPGKPTRLLCHLIDYACKQQRHVTRSTFAAELFAACDAMDHGLLLATMLHQVSVGTVNISEARQLREFGGWLVRLALAVDAYSVFAAVSAHQIKIPAEKSLVSHVQFLRELLDRGVLHRLWWLDTRDMSADGLTKGVIDREAVHAIMDGVMYISHKSQTWRSALADLPQAKDAPPAQVVEEK